jgi:hypothetical protein
MQFILSEEEYKKLIHKDRISGPVQEFCGTLEAIVKRHKGHDHNNPYSRLDSEVLKAVVDSLNTLKIKLDL